MKLKVNWPYLIVCLMLWGAMCGFIGGAVTLQTLSAVQRGLPIPGGWSWLSVVILDLACFVAFLWLAWKVHCDVRTVITQESISQPRLFGSFEIAWSQATRITTYGHGITVHGQGSQIVLTPYAYMNPNEVVAEIARLAERHSLQMR